MMGKSSNILAIKIIMNELNLIIIEIYMIKKAIISAICCCSKAIYKIKTKNIESG